MKAVSRSFLIVLAAIGAAGSAAAAESVSRYASPVTTLVCTGEVTQRDSDALSKMGSSYAQAYRFSTMNIWYEEPLRMRLESLAGRLKVTYIINGDRKKAFGAGLSKTWNIKGRPGQLQTLNVVGLATPAWLALCNEKYLGNEKLLGATLKVFELHYKDAPGGAYFRVSMDPATRTIRAMRIYGGDGVLKVGYRYLKPVKTRGVHIPTRVEIFAPTGSLAAVTEVRGIVADKPIEASRFTF